MLYFIVYIVDIYQIYLLAKERVYFLIYILPVYISQAIYKLYILLAIQEEPTDTYSRELFKKEKDKAQSNILSQDT